MSIIISSPNVRDTEDLYGIYIQQLGNEKATIDDFYVFLSTDSPCRKLFLDAHCIYSFQIVESTVVLKFEKK